MLTTETKSKVVLGLIKDIPGFMTKKDVRALATDPKNNILGIEDAAAAVSSITLDEKEKTLINKEEKSTSMSDLFPNIRLTAELEIIKETDRVKYKSFCDKMLELDSIAQEIDAAAGPSLDFLLDELKQNADIESINAIKNMGVSIVNIEEGKIAKK